MNEGFPLRRMPLAGTIEVWTIDLDRPLNSAVDIGAILSVEERERAERFLAARDASRFRVCRAMLRLGLAWYLKTAPQEIELTANPLGKPRIAEPSALHFNVSHSGGLGTIAFTTIGEVGIDVEAMGRGVEALEIAASHFTRNESEMVAAAASPQEQAEIFLRLWTRKEAVLKAAGCGLMGGLERFDVSTLPLDEVRLCCGTDVGDESCWRIEDMEPIEGFAGSVAAPCGSWSVRQYAVDCDTLMRRFAKEPGGGL